MVEPRSPKPADAGSNPATTCYRIVHLTPDHEDYEQYMLLLASEPLRTQWWLDAESEVEPGISYLMVLADHEGELVPAAWAGYAVSDGELRCCNNYVRRGFRGRYPELYQVAYAARHRDVVAVLGLPAVTYLFEYPIPLHLADGWVLCSGPDAHGLSRAHEGGEVHTWWRLRWSPPDLGTGPADGA